MMDGPIAVLGPDVPLHHQIFRQLRAEIEDGIWIGRTDFPGENEVARRFGVSVLTARTALNRLVSDGWIDRGRGRRTRVVRSPGDSAKEPAPEILSTSNRADFTYEVIRAGVDVAPIEACAAFGVPAGSKLFLCSRLRRFEGRPHSVTLNAQPVAIGARMSKADLQTLPMVQILKAEGIRLARMRRTMGVSLPSSEVAHHLGLTLNDPTLIYTFTQHDTHNDVVQWVRIWGHPAQPSPEEIFDYQTGTWSKSHSM